MDTPSFKEDHISQIPALQLLQNLGYRYLTPEEGLQLRGGKTTNVLLEDVLDVLVEVGNGTTDKELHAAADDLFKFRGIFDQIVLVLRINKIEINMNSNE